MPTKHITKQIEAYLDQRLSADDRRRIEQHVAICPACAHQLFEARRLSNELGPVMKKTLGQPVPAPALRQQIRQALYAKQGSRWFSFPWAASGRILNAVGTLAIVAVVAFGAFIVIQNQAPQVDAPPDIKPLRGGDGDGAVIAVNTPMRLAEPNKRAITPTRNLVSLRDTLSFSSPGASSAKISVSTPTPLVNMATGEGQPRPEPSRADRSAPITEPKLAGGTIAFTSFNSGSQLYEIHFINPDGTNRRRFPLAGVSDPAVRSTDDGGYQIAYRAWGEPTTPRALVSNNLAGDRPATLTYFWEDAQPDWSPTENRIIFASQRESDRRWRLYTVWGDGSAEVNLRREGKSPSFAPDGYRFAFESCDNHLSQDRCGLWLANLDESEYGATLFLEDPLAHSPDWSPVGEEIAYMANPEGNWDLYLVNSDGSNVRRLTIEPAIDGLPTWSPDGKWLAFLSNRGEHWAIWLLHAATGQTRRVFSFAEGEFTPPPRPDYDERQWWDEQLGWSQ